MESLAKRLKPYLSDGVSFDKMDKHTRQALDIYIHFKSRTIMSLPKDQRREAALKLPDEVRDLVREECRRLLETIQL